MDIFAEFEIELLESKGIGKENIGCGKGAFDRSAFGPFGILAIANDQLSELTPIYFSLSNTNSTTSFCVDETRYLFPFADLNLSIVYIFVRIIYEYC